MNWSPWQLGENAIELPSTAGGSRHNGVKFACFRCGSDLVSSDQVYRFRNGAVWSNCLPSSVVKESNSPIYNKFKKCNMFPVKCRQCNLNCGQLFPDRYEPDPEDADEDKPFPCVKLTYIWKSNKHDKLFNTTVIRSDTSVSNEKEAVEDALLDMDINNVADCFSHRPKTSEYDDFHKAKSASAATSSSTK